MWVKKNRTMFIGFTAVFICFVTGSCRTIGPNTIENARFDYTDAISSSWKKQMLLNLVKIRYGDTPIFLDVSSIINQYALETELHGGLSWNAFLPTDSQNVSVRSRYSDRPTITYNPMTGEKFTRSLLTPIPPASILALVQGGWPVDRILQICVQSINGIDNHAGHASFSREADPDFYHLITRLKEIQKRGGVGVRIEKKEKDVDTIIFFESEDKDIQQEVVKLKKLLRLNTESNEFKLVYGRLPKSSNELAILSRSIMEILLEMGTYIDVPQKDLDDGRVLPVLSSTIEKEFNISPIIQIHSSFEKPNDAYLAVSYREYWFWVDDRDPRSKGILTFLLILFSLAETSGPSQAPILTIPAG
jgi:hypothetical protein